MTTQWLPRFRSMIVAALAFGAVWPASAQAQWWRFESRRYFDPLVADVRAAQTSVLFGSSDPFEFSPIDGSFQAWDVSLGLEVPLIGWESESTRLNDFTAGGGGFGFWLPISFHMIGDIGHPEFSRPIVNTDYRFGLALKGVYKPWDRTAFEARAGVFHESTHLGDEFSILAVRNGEDFRRINVAYEALDYGVGLRSLLTLPLWNETQLLLRHTGTYIMTNNYYLPTLEETPGTVTAPNLRYEPGFGVQFLSDRVWVPSFSVQAINRIVYGYDRATESQPEARQWSWNVLMMFRMYDFDFAQRGNVLLYGRYYDGVNPAGQFRNEDSYRIWGGGLMIRVGVR